jgi:hypothetical protein
MNRLENEPSKRIQTERVFLKTIVKGNADLYQYIDENNKVHFFYKKNSSIKELNYVQFLTKEGQKAEIFEYRNQLENIFADCPLNNIRHYIFSKDALTKYFEEYNTCNKSLSYSPEKVNTKNNLTMVETVFGTSKSYSPLLNLSNSGIGFTSAVGFSLKRFLIDGRYEYAQFSDSALRSSISITSPTIVVGYKLRN